MICPGTVYERCPDCNTTVANLPTWDPRTLNCGKQEPDQNLEDSQQNRPKVISPRGIIKSIDHFLSPHLYPTPFHQLCHDTKGRTRRYGSLDFPARARTYPTINGGTG